MINRINYCGLLFLVVLLSCAKEPASVDSEVGETPKELLRGMDLSSLPEIEDASAIYRDVEGKESPILALLKENDVNLIRLRLWHTPLNSYSGLEELKLFAARLRDQGFKICLSIHYSDSWADPGKQKIPTAWENLSFSVLKDSVSAYTRKVMLDINPDYVQLGNEINAGLLFPMGKIDTAESQFIELLQTAAKAVRDHTDQSKIILHFAGHTEADWFFDKLKQVDYDIIGLSYYPIWHGKSLTELAFNMKALHEKYQKELLILETAYPFTLGWNDHTNNIVGLEEQLLLPDYPASVEGQKAFLNEIKNIALRTTGAIGFCYWGGELIAFNGPQATNGSVWENQALFDFEHLMLPAMTVFNKD